jgi:histidine kinase
MSGPLIAGYTLKTQLYSSARTLVYRGSRDHDGLPVILKLLNEASPGFEDVTRFQREYEIGRRVSEAGAVRVLALEPVLNSWAIVMEDSGARALRLLMEERRLRLDEVLRFGAGIAAALAAIHRQNVIHKDVNPANIIVEPVRETVRLIDFGLATQLSREAPSFLNPQLLEGTLRYISPEQTGRMNRAIDHRADLYSLGVTLYEMLTGKVPFAATDAMEFVHQHIAQQPVPPHGVDPSIPLPLSEIVLKLLSKRAEDRYQSALGVQKDLEFLLGAGLSRERAVPAGLADFIPGQNDVFNRFQLPQKLYGREAQLEALTRVLERAARHRAELALVAGESGMGKSVLVHELQRSVLGRHALFVSGKFDLLQHDVPYASLSQGFSDFLRHLLTLSEEQLSRWRLRLSEALGENGQVIVEVLPLLKQIIGTQPPMAALPAQEARLRFTFVFQRFVMALGTEKAPLVLFLDDLQWADLPSLHLIQSLLENPRAQHLLIVGAYRENEVGNAHPLRQLVAAVEKADTPVTTLFLSPLKLEHVEQLVVDTFHRDTDYAAPLIRLLWERSGGNAFFLAQLLRTLHEERLVVFSHEDASWHWDLEEIRARGLTDNIIQLMVRKLRNLPEATQRVLERAACIGNRFQLGSLAIVQGHPAMLTSQELSPAIEEGLILPLDNRWRLAEQGWTEQATYKFLHDRVQQAAYSLIPEESRPELHLRIARLLLARTAPEDLEERLTDLVQQFNLGCVLITDEEERHVVARLNLQAGQKAKASAAFAPALRYFSTGLSLLPEDAWTQHYELCLELHTETMEAEYLNAHPQRGDALAELVLTRAREPIQKAKVYASRASFASAQKYMTRAIDDGYQGLALLGLELPRHVNHSELLEAVRSVKLLMAGKNAKDLLTLPLMTDPRWLAASQISLTLIASIYLQDVLVSFALTMEMVKLCLQHGNPPEAPYHYSGFASMHAALLGDVDTAIEYGDIAFEMLTRLDVNRVKAKVYMHRSIFTLHLKVHLRETMPLLKKAIQAGQDCGDLQFMGYSATLASRHAFYASEPLEEVLQEHARNLELMIQWKLEIGAHAVRAIQQTCFCLMGRARDAKRLQGDSFDEEVELPWAQAKQYSAGLSELYLQKMLLAYLFRDADLAVAMSEAGEPYASTQMGQFAQPLRIFLQSLVLLMASKSAAEDTQKQAVAKVRQNQDKLNQWATRSPMNWHHRYQLVEAELARVQADSPSAARLYEEALTGARKQGYVNDEALCHELMGEFFLGMGRVRLAHDSFVDAAAAYRRWGAEAKVADLEKRYPQAFKLKRAPAFHSASAKDTESSSSQGEQLDLSTVLKAEQTISGEIRLDRLLDRLIQIAMENAGAQRGMLILVRGGQLTIEAEQTMGPSSAPALPEAVEGSPRLSTAIVHFAARTLENVVLDDASTQGMFIHDPYVAQHHLRSVLCAPLINQGQLVALLYLENNHTTRAFTADRLGVLRLLSAQAALSLKNALLFAQLEDYSHTLEQRVEERTRELQTKNEALDRAMRQLRDTQKKLVAQEKLASLGALTAGIAHELKNPLNFINNFTEITMEFADELSTGVKAQFPQMPMKSAQDLDQLLTRIQQSVSKVQEHGQRATQIINRMLMHSRDSSEAKASVNLNKVLEESLSLSYRGLSSRVDGFTLDVQTHYDPAVGEVEMVASELSRVFINAVDNACYALQQKKKLLGDRFSPRLEVSTRARGALAEVRIRDNGPGIPDALLDKVFTPFFTTKPAGEGTGLGLSLSHDIIVGGHHGELRIDSVEGEFTELIIEIPRSAS